MGLFKDLASAESGRKSFSERTEHLPCSHWHTSGSPHWHQEPTRQAWDQEMRERLGMARAVTKEGTRLYGANPHRPRARGGRQQPENRPHLARHALYLLYFPVVSAAPLAATRANVPALSQGLKIRPERRRNPKWPWPCPSPACS